MVDGHQDIVQESLQVICPPQVPQGILKSCVGAFERLRETEFADHDILDAWEEVLSDGLQELPDSTRRALQPTCA